MVELTVAQYLVIVTFSFIVGYYTKKIMVEESDDQDGD